MAQSQLLTKLFKRMLFSEQTQSFIRESHNGSVCRTSSVLFHRWKHTAPIMVNPLSLTSLRCSCPVSVFQNKHNTRSFSKHVCLQQKEDQTSSTSDPDVEYIQKELDVETKVTKKKKQKHAAADLRNSVINVGKFVPDKILELLDEDGTSLGTVNRSQAISLSREKKLKLVLMKPLAKPWPLYKLMTGQELHEEQVKRNEMKKKKTAPTQLKELKASWNIGENDIAVRRRQLESWFSEGHAHVHAKVTVSGGRKNEVVSQEKQMEVVNKMMKGMEDRITLNAPPQMAGKNMSTLKVTLRAMSAKEKAAYRKSVAEKTPGS